MRHPDSPASRSVSPAGDMADDPMNVIQIAVTDQDDEKIGFLIQWRADEWFYADVEAFSYLENLE